MCVDADMSEHTIQDKDTHSSSLAAAPPAAFGLVAPLCLLQREVTCTQLSEMQAQG